jgi:RNA polymerase sigma factor for flagellar operon FliA
MAQDHSSREDGVGDSSCSERDALILDHLSTVKVIATRIRRSLPVHVELDDLVQAGTLGLIDAANKFNKSKQLSFATYAWHRIKGAILDSLRQLDGASRGMRRLNKQVELTRRNLTQILQRAPADIEVAETLEIDVDKMRRIMVCVRGLTPRFAAPQTGEDARSLELPAGSEMRPDAICAQKELLSLVGTTVQRLSPRDQKVLTLYYNDEMTMRQIGILFGVNESRISQLHRLAMQKIEMQLRNQGFTSSNAF